MPAHRGSLEQDDNPDTKVPITYIPGTGEYKCTKLSTIVTRLNLGDYESEFHYGAMAYLQNIKKYILLYRVATQPWSVNNFLLLKSNKEDSLNIIDTSKKIQAFMNKCQGLIPVKYTRKRKRNSQTGSGRKGRRKGTRRGKTRKQRS
jgi:hypothetical protein